MPCQSNLPGRIVQDAVRSIVIVGASAAGLAAATALRDNGFDGSITMIGAEDNLPYDRPPLSKTDCFNVNDIALTTAAELAEMRIETRLGLRAVELDYSARSVLLENGEMVRWDRCIIATGADPISLSPNSLILRSHADAIRMSQALDGAQHIAIVGGGVLGCEVAALAVKRGVAVTVVDPLQGPMHDKVGPFVSERLLQLHQHNNVTFRFGCKVTGISQRPSGEYAVGLDEKSTLDVDHVVVAIGCRPATSWLQNSGVPLDNGVLCDQYCEALPGVYAAGDVANFYNPRFGRRMRIEHRMNATEQGLAVAENILGTPQPFAPIPFFWSDQYDTKLQVYGMIGPDCETSVLAGDAQGGNFLLAYNRNGLVEGVLGWNMAKGLRTARALIGEPSTATMGFLA